MSVRGFLSRRRAGEARQGYLAQFPARFAADLGPIGQLRLASTNLQVASANRLADAPVVGLVLLALDVKAILTTPCIIHEGLSIQNIQGGVGAPAAGGGAPAAGGGAPAAGR